MQIRIYNQYASSLTIMEQEIASQNTYTVPTADLLSWLADLTFRIRLTCNLIQLQDEFGNGMSIDDAQDLARAIISNEVTTS